MGMPFPILFLKVLRDLRGRRLRSLLTVFGIAIGVAGLVAMVSLGENVVAAQAATYASTSQADLDYWVWNAAPGVLRAVEAVPNVEQAELRASYYTKWRVGDSWRDMEIIGLADPTAVALNQFALVEGRLPQPGELLVEISARELGPVQVGQEITYREGQTLRQRSAIVSGLSRSPSYLSSILTSVTRAYAPAADVLAQLGTDGYNQLLVRLRDPARAPETVQRINRLLERRGIQHGTPLVRDARNLPGRRELDALIVLLTVFSVVGLGVSCFLVSNTLLALLAEQVREVGIIKALGGRRAQVMRLFLLSAAIYGLLGTLLGLGLGALGGWLLLRFVGRLGNVVVPFRLAGRGVLLGVVVGAGVSLLAGSVPALVGARTPVHQALQGYGITAAYQRSRLGTWLSRCLALSPTMAMALHNLARRRGRALVTVAAIALAAAAFLATQSTRASVDSAIAEAFATYGADAWVWFGQPVGAEFARTLATVPGVKAAEAWTLANAWADGQPVRLWGLPADTRLYQPRLQEGRWFAPQETDTAVVSAELAQALDLHLDDWLDVETAGNARRFRVVGVVVDNSILLGSTMAGKVFAPRTVVSRMLSRQGVADLFAVGLTDHAPPHVDRAMTDIEERFRPLRPGTQAVYTDIQAAQRASQLLSVALVGMVLLVGLIGAIGIINTLGLSVLERRREIGVLRAIGAQRRALLSIFVGEGLIMGALGWMAGLACGYPLGLFFTHLMESVLFQIDYRFSPWLLLATLLFTLTLAAIASLGPALAAAQMPAQQALRYE
ncbi:MAG: ABC transporter permease [Anaerolineae bacterium]